MYGKIKERDQYETLSEEWVRLNNEKADLLEKIKPSTKERIIYFDESSLKDIKTGFDNINVLPDIPFYVERRSFLEYCPPRRHPIPYCIIKNGSKYFFILRESGSGEIRLIGKKGMVGGHIGEEDIENGNLNTTIMNGMFRELEEEAGIKPSMVKSLELKGVIKSNEGVDADHLGLVYEIELYSADGIKAEEEGILKGIWIDKEKLNEHYESFESWSKIVYNNILTAI